MANSAVGIVLVIGIIVVVFVVFGSTIIATGSSIINNLSKALADFFKNLGESTGITPTPTPPASPTPTATLTPTPTPTSQGSFQVTMKLVVPPIYTDPMIQQLGIYWKDETSGASGAITEGINPNGQTITVGAGDLLTFYKLSASVYNFDHWTSSSGGSSGTNPLSVHINQDITVTAYFVER